MHGLLIFLDHEAQFMFVMPWQFPLLTLPLWCRWSCCRNCSEDWPPLQIQSLQQKYCMLKVTITVHLWVSSVPEYHRRWHTWSGVSTDLGSQTAEGPLIRYTPGHSQRRSLSWRIWDFTILSYIFTCSGAEDTKCQAWVLCWWHFKKGVAMAAICPVTPLKPPLHHGGQSVPA